MEPSDPNPYQAPKNSAEIVVQQRKRPNVYDWIVAVVLGVIAFVIAIPTTCFGYLIGIGGLGTKLKRGSPLGSWIYTALDWGAIIFIIASPFIAGYLYIRAINKRQARRAEKEDEPKV